MVAAHLKTRLAKRAKVKMVKVKAKAEMTHHMVMSHLKVKAKVNMVMAKAKMAKIKACKGRDGASNGDVASQGQDQGHGQGPGVPPEVEKDGPGVGEFAPMIEIFEMQTDRHDFRFHEQEDILMVKARYLLSIYLYVDRTVARPCRPIPFRRLVFRTPYSYSRRCLTCFNACRKIMKISLQLELRWLKWLRLWPCCRLGRNLSTAYIDQTVSMSIMKVSNAHLKSKELLIQCFKEGAMVGSI